MKSGEEEEAELSAEERKYVELLRANLKAENSADLEKFVREMKEKIRRRLAEGGSGKDGESRNGEGIGNGSGDGDGGNSGDGIDVTPKVDFTRADKIKGKDDANVALDQGISRKTAKSEEKNEKKVSLYCLDMSHGYETIEEKNQYKTKANTSRSIRCAMWIVKRMR